MRALIVFLILVICFLAIIYGERKSGGPEVIGREMWTMNSEESRLNGLNGALAYNVEAGWTGYGDNTIHVTPGDNVIMAN